MKNINEFKTERVLNYPRELVWRAWTNANMVKQWWGPNNVTIAECEIELRPGGKIYIVMVAGEAMGPYKGTKWPMLGKFTIVEPNSKLFFEAKAWTDGQKEETMIEQTTELILTEKDGKTKLQIKAVIHKAGPGASMAVQGMEHGFNQQLSKLNDFLAEKTK